MSGKQSGLVVQPPITTVASRPHARLDDDEDGYLRVAAVPPLDCFLLVRLRLRTDRRTGRVHDRLETLARQSGMSQRQVTTALKRLKALGLINRAPERTRGGPQGHAWTWTTAVRPFESWSAEPLLRRIAAIDAYVRVFYGREQAAGAPSSGKESTQRVRPLPAKSSHAASEELAQNDGRARTSLRDNSTYGPPGISPERESTVATLVDRWRQLREAHGNPQHRFTDRRGIAALVRAIHSALDAGAPVADLRAAIEANATLKWADPGDLGAWVAAAAQERTAREDLGRRRRDALQAERERDRATEESWRELQTKYPGRSRAEILSLEGGRQMGAA